MSNDTDDDGLARVRALAIDYVTRITASPLQFGVFLLAAWLTSNGPGAYLLCPQMLFSPLQTCTVTVFGFIPVTVNAVHALMHLISGAVGLILVMDATHARLYAIFGGLYYAFWGVSMLPVGDEVRDALGVDVFGSWVHVIEGALLLALFLFTRRNRPTVPLST